MAATAGSMALATSSGSSDSRLRQPLVGEGVHDQDVQVAFDDGAEAHDSFNLPAVDRAGEAVTKAALARNLHRSGCVAAQDVRGIAALGTVSGRVVKERVDVHLLAWARYQLDNAEELVAVADAKERARTFAERDGVAG